MNDTAKHTGFLDESPGNKSFMRLASLICICSGIFIAILGIVIHGQPFTTTCIGLVTLGMSGKAYQKIQELKAKSNGIKKDTGKSDS